MAFDHGSNSRTDRRARSPRVSRRIIGRARTSRAPNRLQVRSAMLVAGRWPRYSKPSLTRRLRQIRFSRGSGRWKPAGKSMVLGHVGFFVRQRGRGRPACDRFDRGLHFLLAGLEALLEHGIRLNLVADRSRMDCRLVTWTCVRQQLAPATRLWPHCAHAEVASDRPRDRRP